MKEKLPLIVLIISTVASLAAMGVLLYIGVLWKRPKFSNVQEEQKIVAKAEETVLTSMEVDLGALTINLSDKSGSGANRILRIHPVLEVSGNSPAEELNTKKARITDIVISLLAVKKSTAISELRGKIALKDELIEKINGDLKQSAVKDIFFQEFVIQ